MQIKAWDFVLLKGKTKRIQDEHYLSYWQAKRISLATWQRPSCLKPVSLSININRHFSQASWRVLTADPVLPE